MPAMSTPKDEDEVDCTLLDVLLPRYLRRVPWNVSTIVDERVENVLPLKSVTWNPVFAAAPGSVRLTQEFPAYKEHGWFPMDIASSLAIFALQLPSDRKCTVLDLCCCPGAKFRMLSDLLSADSVVVGVDISESRLSVCKSLMESWERLSARHCHSGARQLLFRNDGITFGCAGLGQLLYDSEILRNEIRHDTQTSSRKRKNKSAKAREGKKLKLVCQAMESIVSGSPPHTAASADIDQSSDEMIGEAVDCRGFDFVLVDAECTHDASYRHMLFARHAHKWNSDSSKQVSQSVLLCDANDATQHVNSDSNIRLSHDIAVSALSSADDSCASQRDALRDTQRGLIANGFARLNVGGVLVYSTCSREQRQNEDVVQWLLQAHADAQLESVAAALQEQVSLVVADSDVNDTDGSNTVQSFVTRLSALGPAKAEELSKECCEQLCSQSGVKAQRGLGALTDTMRVGFQSGMSGHFIARIRKVELRSTIEEIEK